MFALIQHPVNLPRAAAAPPLRGSARRAGQKSLPRPYRADALMVYADRKAARETCPAFQRQHQLFNLAAIHKLTSASFVYL